MKEKCKKCKNQAKYKVVTPFGEFLVCGVHKKKYENKIASVVYYLNKGEK